MSGSTAFERASASFSANTAVSNNTLANRSNGLMEKYQNQVRGFQDKVANIKAVALAKGTQAFQEQVEKGKQLSEASLGGFAAYKGVQKARSAYKGAKSVVQAKMDATAKARESSGASEKGGEEPDVGNLDESTTAESSDVTLPKGAEADAAPAADAADVADVADAATSGAADVASTAADAADAATSGAADVADAAMSGAADVASTAADAADAVGTGAADVASTATGYAADLADSASAITSSATNSMSSIATAASDAADAVGSGVSDAIATGGTSLLEGALDLGGAGAAESAGLIAAAPEVFAVAALVGGIGAGLYDIFHHNKPNAPPVLPSAPVMEQTPEVSAALVHARNAFVTPSFDSVIDTPAASAAF